MNEANALGRRDFGASIVTCSLLALAGCNGSRSGPSVDNELSALAEAISSLSSTVGRFKDDEWKDVVPDVESDASDVVNAFANLKAAMGKQ